MKVQAELKVKVWNWVAKVYTEAPDMSYLYKFPVGEDQVEYGDYGDHEWWKCLDQLVEEGWLERVEGPMNQIDYRWGKNMDKLCKKHKSIMTYGRYSRNELYDIAQKQIGENWFYCNSCVDEIIDVAIATF